MAHDYNPTLDVLRWLQDWFAVYPYGPTLTEIASGNGYAQPSSAARQLDKLESWGLVQREPGKARATRLTEVGATFNTGR